MMLRTPSGRGARLRLSNLLVAAGIAGGLLAATGLPARAASAVEAWVRSEGGSVPDDLARQLALVLRREGPVADPSAGASRCNHPASSSGPAYSW